MDLVHHYLKINKEIIKEKKIITLAKRSRSRKPPPTTTIQERRG